MTYDQAIVCPRCHQPGNARVIDAPNTENRLFAPESPTGRIGSVYCEDKSCSYYYRTWFFRMDEEGNITHHTLY